MMGTALLAVPSCTDTWNAHYDNDNNSYDMAKESLWELLESRDDLSNFREIAAKATFYRDETHPAFTLNGKDTVFYTFKDVLSANTPVTLWAPVNSAMSQDEWDNFSKMAETDGYNLQQQLIGCHMALYRKSMSNTGKKKFRLINNKFVTIDYADKTFEKSLVTEADIPARNGLLHVIASRNEFFYNLYEYVKFSGEVTSFRNYLVERDTTYFLAGSSIEGLPDSLGNPTYVDSAYLQDNMMFSSSLYNPTGSDAEDAWMSNMKMFHAQINIEDSSFVMIVPTDLGWEAMLTDLGKYYKYTSKYPRMDKLKESEATDDAREVYGARKTFNNGRGYETVDSLQAVNMEMDMIDPLVFNVNLQPRKNGEAWTKETFITRGYAECEYLLTTRGDTIRDIYEEIDGVKTLVWSKKELFEGSQVKETKEMSNGYAIVSDAWKYHRSLWMRDIDVDITWSPYFKTITTLVRHYDINNNVAQKWIDDYGRCNEQDYVNIKGDGDRATADAVYELFGHKNLTADVMSAKYDVQLVLVPLWYNTSYSEPDLPKDGVFSKAKLICTLYYWSEDMVDKKNLKYDQQTTLASKEIHYTGEKVDTITIMEDVTFPLSYKNIKDAYPVLNISVRRPTNSEKRQGYLNECNIDRIILKCKEAN